MQLMVFDRKTWTLKYKETEKGHQAYLESRRRYYQNHKNEPEFKTKYSERSRRYRLANAETLKEKHRQYFLRRKAEDPNFMIRNRERLKMYHIKNRDNPEYQAKIKEKNKKKYLKMRQDPVRMAAINEKVKKRWREMTKEKRKLHNVPVLKNRHKIREAIFHKLGQYWCQRCGEHDRRCLQFDHINGGGTKEILKYSRAMNAIYSYYLSLENIQDHLMVLCANCNWIKRFTNRENGKFLTTVPTLATTHKIRVKSEGVVMQD